MQAFCVVLLGYGCNTLMVVVQVVSIYLLYLFYLFIYSMLALTMFVSTDYIIAQMNVNL